MPGIERESKGPGRWLQANKRITIAGALALALIALALLVPLLPLQDPLEPDYDRVLEPPSASHLLGTDTHGRDQLSRILWASRTSLYVGVVATSLAFGAGIIFGGIAGYGGRFVDSIFMRFGEVFLAFPVVLGAMAIMVMFGPGRTTVFMALALFGWPVFARVFRSSVISVKESEYVKAARALGASDFRIFMTHILPNSITPLISYTAMSVAGAILAEASLSFVGLGIQRPYPSWGTMLDEAMGLFEVTPWFVLAPGVAVTVTAAAFIILGGAASRAIVEPGGSA